MVSMYEGAEKVDAFCPVRFIDDIDIVSETDGEGLSVRVFWTITLLEEVL